MTAYSNPNKGSLKSRAMNAGAWTMGGYFMMQVLRLGSNMLVTRLLAPDIYAVAALFMSLMITVGLLCDMGIHQAVVASKRGDDPRMLRTAWTLQVIRGFFVWMACALVGLAVYQLGQTDTFKPGSAFADPTLPLVVVLGSSCAFIQSLQSAKLFLAERHLVQHRVIMIEIAALVVTIAVNIVLALQWKSVWALVIGQLVGTVVHAVLTHVALPGPRMRWFLEKQSAQEIWQVGRWIMLSTSLFVISIQADKLMLGAVATAAQLSFYTIAFTLATAIELVAQKVIYSVGAPAFSEVVRSDPSRLPQVVHRVRKMSDAFFLGCAGFACAIGPSLIRIMYDDRYQDAGWILSILVVSLIFIRYSIFLPIYTAMGLTKYLPTVNLAKLVGMAVMLPLGYMLYGVTGVYWAVALHMLPAALLYLYLNHRHGMFSWRFELSVLLVFPAAYALGWLLVKAVRSMGWLA
jgi:O-antigen/teichoic acid export membrane protein